jgi:hypothetical protein
VRGAARRRSRAGRRPDGCGRAARPPIRTTHRDVGARIELTEPRVSGALGSSEPAAGSRAPSLVGASSRCRARSRRGSGSRR